MSWRGCPECHRRYSLARYGSEPLRKCERHSLEDRIDQIERVLLRTPGQTPAVDRQERERVARAFADAVLDGEDADRLGRRLAELDEQQADHEADAAFDRALAAAGDSLSREEVLAAWRATIAEPLAELRRQLGGSR